MDTPFQVKGSRRHTYRLNYLEGCIQYMVIRGKATGNKWLILLPPSHLLSVPRLRKMQLDEDEEVSIDVFYKRHHPRAKGREVKWRKATLKDK